MITGINHLTFSVSSLDASFAFYTEVLGCKALARWPKGTYLLAGDLWIALTFDPQTRSTPLPEYTHTAFNVAPADFAAMEQRIRQSGARIWQENSTEGDSLYFLDPDGHKLEIHATGLAVRLDDARRNPWLGLQIMDA